jgi:DNA-binding beta-propeller fold protein YncE
MIPFGVAIDPAGKFVYVVNSGSDNISAFAIDQATGALTPIADSPFPTGMGPGHMAIDPTGQFAYVANCGNTGNCHVIKPGNVWAYVIDSATGALAPVTGSPFAAEMGSAFAAVDPSGQFVYISNIHSGNISAFAIDAASGALTQIPGSPFVAGGGPLGLAATPGPPTP